MPGKSHKKKDRTLIVRKLTELFKNEKVAIYVPKRDFNGPEVLPSLENNYDEAQYLSWHYSKTNELAAFLQIQRKLFQIINIEYLGLHSDFPVLMLTDFC